jgi:MFS family permease
MRRLGRKKTMIAAYSLLCTPGSFLQLFAPNMAALVAGRFWNCAQTTPCEEDYQDTLANRF